ncbi:MAG: tryptophan synthase subunit alpha [Blastocatellia bacterium]
MSRITDRFIKLRTSNQKGFIPYITGGDPDLGTTAQLLDALAEAGADVIELGIPFSDPMADGPVIQRASERALLRHIGVEDILPLVKRFRQAWDVPIVLFSYLNPIIQFRTTGFGEALRDAGVDGVLVTDMIPEEAGLISAELRNAGLDMIYLAAPTSTDERLEMIAQRASGFIYAIARTGVTGLRAAATSDVRHLVERIRRYTDLPVAVGFGIHQPAQVRETQEFADAAVVGSRLVQEIENNLGSPALVENVARLARQLCGNE